MKKKYLLLLFGGLLVSGQLIAQQTEFVPLIYDVSGYESDSFTEAYETAVEKDAFAKEKVFLKKPSDTIPTINAEMNVSEKGALTYHIPIEVLKGVNDFQPNIGLAYNSQLGNGQAGWGWNVVGLSTITAGGRSASTDGLTIGRQFDDNDPYYLDGQRLLFSSEREWVTEKYSKIKIVKEQNSEYSFSVHYTDGRIAKYKELLSGQHYIVLMVNALGNEIHYKYQVARAVYIASISYDSEQQTINFYYKNREQPSTLFRNAEAYTNSKVLSGIEVITADLRKVNKTGSYRKYVLTHDRIQSNSVERIKQIAVFNERGESLKPLKFIYNKSSAGLIEISVKRTSKPIEAIAFGSTVTSDFRGTGTPYAVYEIKDKDNNYKIWDPEMGIIDSSSESRQLFAGKFLHRDKITENDWLISVETTYLDRNTEDLLRFKIRDLTSNYSRTIEIKLPGVLLGDYKGRDKKYRKLFVGDFNNDGLVDVIIFQPQGQNINNKCFFWELGKEGNYTQTGRNQQPLQVTLERDDLYKVIDRIFPIEFDGDGIPEFMFVERYEKISMYKLDLINRNLGLKKIPFVTENGVPYEVTLSSFYRDRTPIIFGDFNGDGLTDFITPAKIYSLDKSSSAAELKKMETDKLLWYQYISTGKGFVKRLRDFTAQQLAYMAPSERETVKKASGWDKLWSGKRDKYKFTDYGSSSIIAMDINNDGRTDLISIRKFGRVKYEDNLWDTQFLADDLSAFNNSDQIRFYINENLNTAEKFYFSFASSATTVSLKNRSISPISLIVNRTDHNQLNTYKSGLLIHDPLVGIDTKIVINNDDFLEGQLSAIDNGSPVYQSIEYRPMVRAKGTPENWDMSYTSTNPDLPYPFYINKEFGTHYLTHKIHTETRDELPVFRSILENLPVIPKQEKKILTTEYRYQNAVQQLLGKGFLGFQKTFVSDSYESVFENGKIKMKEAPLGVFWTVKTFDPQLDNALQVQTYGSLNADFVFNTTTYTNQLFNKYRRLGSSRDRKYQYLILPTIEKSMQHLTGVEIKKKYQYDTDGDFLLQQVNTEYGDDLLQIERLEYTPEFFNGQHYFFGKIRQKTNANWPKLKTRLTIPLESSSFSTREEMVYNNKGLVTEIKKWGNNTTSAIKSTFKYYGFGGLQSETLKAGSLPSLVTSYTYDENNRYVVAIKTPDGLQLTKTRDYAGRIRSEVNGFGQTTSYRYDGWGNVVQRVDDLGKKTDFRKLFSEYGSNGSYALSQKTEGQPEVIKTYDSHNREIETKVKSLNDQWVFSRTKYDVFGRPIASSQPFFKGEPVRWNTIEYDALSRPVVYTLFNGRVITHCYDGLKVTTEDGHKTSAKWVNALGQVVTYQDQGGTIKYKYHLNGALKETDYEGIKTNIEIDGWGYQKKLEEPSAGTYLYEYNELGQLKKTTNPKGGISSYNYDVFGKLISEQTNSSVENTQIDINYYYDDKTKLPTEVKGRYNGKDYVYTTAYDQHFRVKEKIEKTPYFSHHSKMEYDEFGRVKTTELNTKLSALNQSGKTVTNHIYDSNGLLVKQVNGQTSDLIWEINAVNANGYTTQMKYGNGIILKNTYNDTTDLLEEIRHFKRTNSVLNIAYNYDSVKGLLLQRNNLVFGKTENFGYDALDRLVTESVDGSISRKYTYDRSGKMTSNTQLGKYIYDKSNYQLEELRFNAGGQQLDTIRGFAEIRYNAFKSPDEIHLENKDRISFEHSIFNTRSASYYGSLNATASDRPNMKWYSADQTVEIIKTADQTKLITYANGDPYSANYIQVDVFGKGGLLSSKNYYLHRDHQQSIVGITDGASAAIVEQRDFDAWGNLRQARIGSVLATPDQQGWVSELILDRDYTGHEHLGTVGLIHMNGRIYDPELRRFMSPDNYVQQPFNTQSFNRYSYVLNNPLMYTDPSGEIWVAVGIGAAVAIVSNSIVNMLNFTPFWHGMGKSAAIGAVSGAISFGIGSLAESTFANTVNQALFQGGMHGVSSGIMTSVEGGNFVSGFASGSVSSLVSSGIQNMGTNTSSNFKNSTTFKAVLIATGGLSGGLSSAIAGGNFWIGARQGIIVSALNHVAHQAFSNGDQGGDPAEQCVNCDGIWGDSGGFWKRLALFLYEVDPEGQSFDRHMQFAIDEGASIREAGIYSFYRTKTENGGLSFVGARGKSKGNAAKGGIQLTKKTFGHTFTTHGDNMTNFLLNRAKGSGMVQGQFLNNQKAAQFILDNMGKTINGAVNIPIPKGFPARIIMPDGTFKAATHIRLVPSGSGVKTAYPLIP